MHVLRTGLFVVAPLAERLPVALVPEEFRISSVRSDMIHNRRRCRFSLFQAFFTERMKL
jgi:hypothetical protein